MRNLIHVFLCMVFAGSIVHAEPLHEKHKNGREEHRLEEGGYCDCSQGRWGSVQCLETCSRHGAYNRDHIKAEQKEYPGGY